MNLLHELKRVNDFMGGFIGQKYFPVPNQLNASDIDRDYVICNIPRNDTINLNLFGRKVTLIHTGEGEYYSEDVIKKSINDNLIELARDEKMVRVIL